MKRISWIIFSLFLSIPTWGQEGEIKPEYTFTLEEAILFGIRNNYSSRIAEKEVERTLKQKWEIISQGLPQISGNVDYQNLLKQPVTLIPAEIAGGAPGTFVPVRFGTQQNLGGTATWNQLIFDGSYIVGVQSAQTLLQISRNARTKTEQSVKEAIISAYGNVLLAEESVEILQNNVQSINKNFQDTRKIFENGLAEEEDVEQLNITLIGLENNLNRSRRMLGISYELLNMTLGLPVDTPLTLNEDLDDLAMKFYDLNLIEKEIPVEQNIDYLIAENSAEAARIFVRLEKAKALPTLTAFVNYGFQGYSEKFTFLSSDQEYFSQSILGVSLNIPIFSSGLRSSRTQQKQIEYDQALIELENTENQIRLDINRARSDYEYSLEAYEMQKRNLELAERIENKNQIKFFEGLGSSFELSEAQRQLFSAQQELLQSMLNVITAKATLENLLDTTHYTNEN
jgi:outer membrane protein TolC